MRILTKGRSHKDEQDVLKVYTKLGEDEEEPYCLDSPPTSSLSTSSEEDSSSSSSSDDDDSDESSDEESSSDEEESSDDEEEEKIKPPRNVIMATKSMISHRLPRRKARASNLPPPATQRKKNILTIKKKERSESDGEDDDSQPSTPASHHDSGQEAADALGRELEEMGYNLKSNSFITRTGEEDEERDERYHLPVDEVKEVRQASSPWPSRKGVRERKRPVVAQATESRQDAIEALRSAVSGACTPAKESVPLQNSETNLTLGSRSWYTLLPTQTTGDVKTETASTTEASPSIQTNTSAKLRSDGRTIKNLDSASDIHVTMSGIADVKNSIVMTKKETKKRQVYHPPVDVLRSPIFTNVPPKKVSEKSTEKTKALPPKAGAAQSSSPVMLNEPEKEKVAKESKPTGRKVPFRRRFIAAGESSNSTPIPLDTSPRPLTPRDYKPPRRLTPRVFEERLQRIQAARQQLAKNDGNQTGGGVPKRHITPPTPAGVIQGLRQAAHDQVGGMIDSPPLSPVFIEGLSFLNGNIQEAETTPLLAQHQVDFKGSAEDEDLTCSDMDEPGKGTLRRRKAWFHSSYYRPEEKQSEVEFVEDDDDEDVEIFPTPKVPKSPVKKVLRMFSPRKNWEKQKEFSSKESSQLIFNDDGVLRENNHKRHFACPTPRVYGEEDNQEKKNSVTPWKASSGIPSKPTHDENVPTSTKSVDDALGGMREVGALFKSDGSLLTMDTTFLNLGDTEQRRTTNSNVLGNSVSNGTHLLVANNTIPANDGENLSRQTGDNSTLAGETTGTRDTGTCSGTRLERIEVQIQEPASDDKKKKKGGLMNLFRRKQRSINDVAANEVKVSCEESKPPAKRNMLKNIFQKSSQEKNKEESEQQPCPPEALAQLPFPPDHKATPADVTKTEADPVASPKEDLASNAEVGKQEIDRKLVVVETASSDQMFVVVDNKEDVKGKLSSTEEEVKKNTACSTKEEVQKDKANPTKDGLSEGAEEKKSPVDSSNQRSKSRSPSRQRSPPKATTSSGMSPRHPKSSPLEQPEDAPLSLKKAEQHFSLVQTWNDFMNYWFDPKSQLATSEAESGSVCSAIAKNTARKAIVPRFATCGADLPPEESGFEVVRLNSPRGLSRFSCSAPAVKASPKRVGSTTSPKQKMHKSPLFRSSPSEDENSLIATAEPLPPAARKNQPANSFDWRRNNNILPSFIRSKERPRLTETDPDRAEKYRRRRTEFDGSTLTSLPGGVNSSESNENQYPAVHQREVFSEASEDTSEDAWTKIADAAVVVESALNRIETIHSGDSADPDRLLRQLISVGSSDSAVVHDLENALKVLKKQAARLGVRESDLLLAVKGSDCTSMDEETSINTLTFTEEVIDAYNMIKKTPQRKRRKN